MQALTKMVLTSSNHSVGLAANVQESMMLRVAAPRQPHVFTMNRDLQTRFTAAFLFLLTTAAVVLAWINFRKEAQFVPPYDGVWWLEREGSIVAYRVEANGPGARGGVKPCYRLLAVDGRPSSTSSSVIAGRNHVGQSHYVTLSTPP